MILLNERAENNGKMCQKLMKFDRSCRLINVPHSRLIVFLLTDLILINIDILSNNKIAVKAAFNGGRCKNFFIKFSRNSSASGHFVIQTPTGASPLDPTRVSVKILKMKRLTKTGLI